MADSIPLEISTATCQDFSSWEMISKTWHMLRESWYSQGPTRNFIGDFIDEFKEKNRMVASDYYIIALVAVLFTMHRYLTTKFLLQPLGRLFEFKPKDVEKFPESCCKFVYYTAFAAAEYYLVNHKYPELRYTPGASWTNYSLDMPVPADIHWLYLVEAGFYFHGMYATVFMDLWRKDSIAMMLHHMLANALIIFSLSVRYHRIGLVVLYLHDAADVCLESTKIFTCFNNKGKTKFWDALCTVGFLSFTWIWFYFRLVVYPQIVLFSGGYVIRILLPETSFFFLFNVMMFALFALNIYWFHFIVLLIVRILTGKSRGVEDVREEDDDAAIGASQVVGSRQNGVVGTNATAADKDVCGGNVLNASAAIMNKDCNPGKSTPRNKVPMDKEDAVGNNNGGYVPAQHKHENGSGCQENTFARVRNKAGRKPNDE